MKKIINFFSNPDRLITLGLFIIAYLFIFLVLDIKYVFTDTTITGGDTGSHIYIPYYLKEIFPLIKWWSPDWYSGFPFLYFYPPLMYFLAVIVSFIIPLTIAFKITIFSVVLLFPVAFYLSLKWLGLKSPIPQLGIIFSLFLIFLENYTIYGGNLASLLAGQFSHTASIALIFIFLGAIYQGMKKGNWHLPNILLGSLVILTHPTTGLLLIILAPFLVFQTESLKNNFFYILKVYIGIFLITAFWTLGLIYYGGYLGTMKWTKEIIWSNLFPAHWMPLNIAGVLGILLAIYRKERRLIGLLALTVITLTTYLTVNNLNFWNTRFLPYLSFAILMFAAYFFGSVLIYLKRKLYLGFYAVILIIIVCFSLSTVKANISFTPSWFKWNFEGYEVKTSWSELEELFAVLENQPNGRVLWEYSPEYEKYGTPRVLEAISSFTGQPTFEGLLIESGLSGPFHFINQTETAEKPTAAIAGFEYPPFNFQKGTEHMQISGTTYFVAYSDFIKGEADAQPELEKLTDTGAFSVYRVRNGHLVNTIGNFALSFKDKNWLDDSIEWYKGEDLDYPTVYVKDQQEFDELWGISTKYGEVDGFTPEKMVVTNDKVEFDTSRIGQPHIIKITYFPTWKVKGAQGPYLVSPAYMMVIPTENHVELYFSYGWIDWLGITLTILGIIWLIFFKKVNGFLIKVPTRIRKSSRRP